MSKSVQVVTTMPIDVREKGRKAAKKMFGRDRRLSTYIAYLINKDCEEKGIK